MNDNIRGRTAAAESMRGLINGHVHLPGDPLYDQTRTPWNVAAVQLPAAVAMPGDAAEVATVVHAAADHGLRVAPQSTGHNAGPLAAQRLDDTVLLKTSRMDRVTSDPVRGVVRAEGGALWEPAVAAAAAHGKAVLHGSSPDVGIAGYTLGGGIGWYARKLGLAASSVLAAELVIGDGTLVRVSSEENPELFWALRGGGGNFGVVTAIEFRMYPIDSAYAGLLLWDLADLEPVLREWAAWAPTAPDEVTTSLRVMRFPPMPELPDFLSGRSVAIIDGAVLGSDEHGARLLASLRGLRPEMDTFARVSAASLLRLHMDPEGSGVPVASDSTVLGGLPDAAVEAVLATVGPGAESSLLGAELRQLGGALSVPADHGGALDHLNGSFVSVAIAIAATPELRAAGYADAVRFTDALRRYSAGSEYLNFAENETDVARGFSDEAWLRLQGIRNAVDPGGLFRANHPIPGLPEGGAATH